MFRFPQLTVSICKMTSISHYAHCKALIAKTMFGAHRVGEFSRFRQATFLYRFIINKILISQSKHLYCYRNLRNASLLFFTCDSNQLHDKGIVEQYVLITDMNSFGNVLKTLLCRSMTWTFSASTYWLVYGVSFFCFSLRIMRFLFSLLLFLKMTKAMKRAFN